MKQMISGYLRSCQLVRERIKVLTEQKNELKRNGKTQEIENLMLERRIKLLYDEHSQMQEIISYLNSCVRRAEKSAET
ncbi:MAG: hypothetical protein MR022_07350 [Ruminococcus sp.]|nr:hypothetical protein [Ruminococcus sp.]